MLKCKSCGQEISLGRKLFHKCERNFVYFGKILKDKADSEKTWNCLSNCSDKKRNIPKASCSLKIVRTKKETICTSAFKQAD